MKRKYYPINIPFLYEHDLIMAVPTKDNKPVCTKCFFSKRYRQKKGLKEISCCTHGLVCTSHIRRDKRHVVFVEVDVTLK